MTLQDNGSGISKEDCSKIFEPFFSTKEIGKGSGLGLSMIYGTVQSHEGYIDVESTLGVGTIFSLYFPLVEKIKLIKEETGKTILNVPPQGSGQTILLVDDEHYVVDVNKKILKLLGYNVIEAKNGQEGIELFQDNLNEIDLVISDVIMPQMGGFELAKMILKQKPNTPFLFVTGYNKYKLSDFPYLSDNVKLFTKPFSIESLALEISNLLKTKIINNK